MINTSSEYVVYCPETDELNTSFSTTPLVIGTYYQMLNMRLGKFTYVVYLGPL